MAYVHFDLVSKERQKPIPDKPRVVVKERFHNNQSWTSLGRLRSSRPKPERHGFDIRRNHFYSFEFQVPGFDPVTDRFKVTRDRMERAVSVPSRILTLPNFRQLTRLQHDMLGSMTDRTPDSVWSEFSDNQCATFFQVTYVLASYRLKSGGTLADRVGRLLRVGGSEIRCPSPKHPGRQRTVKGWRLHVEFDCDRRNMEAMLTSNGFAEDRLAAVSTHSDCGYRTSFRARAGKGIGLQICLADVGTGADVDVDVTGLHRSAPWHVCRVLRMAYIAVRDKYDVR